MARDELSSFGGPGFRGRVPSSPEKARQMARVRQRDTRAEMRLRRSLHARGLRFRVQLPLPDGGRRRADVVFPRARVVVFVDGCFWHGCPTHATWPKANADFWREKIETNRRRDRDTDRRLGSLGWCVIRVWEHEDPETAASKIEAVVRAQRPTVGRSQRAQ
jgi:DNA mismatch endonuclease (patch repair protein)